jgi:hypothetical protein
MAVDHLDADDEEAEAAAALRASIAATRSRALGTTAGSRGPGAAAAAAAAGPFAPRSDLLNSLGEFGFSRERSYRALQATGNSTVEGAVDWLTTHQDDAGIDDPIPGFSEGAAAAASSAAPSAAAASGGVASAMEVEHAGAVAGAQTTVSVVGGDAAAAGGAGGASSAGAAAAARAVASREDLSEEDKAAITAAEALLNAEESAAAGSCEWRLAAGSRLHVVLGAPVLLRVPPRCGGYASSRRGAVPTHTRLIRACFVVFERCPPCLRCPLGLQRFPSAS